MTIPDLPALLETARDAVSAASRDLRSGAAGQVTAKGDRDVVTELDIAIERRTRDFLRTRTPAIGFLGEEEGGDTGPGLRWILDPVDGTANFAAGLPLFAVMASVVVKGETVAGIIYDPMGDDWMIAERGAGAWLRRPDGQSRRLAVADPVPVDQMIAHVSIGFLDPASKPKVLANLIKVAISANYRCAGHDYRTLASGHCHAVLFNKLMPWDHLPGTLICAEAGAHVRKFDGSDYRPGDLSGGLLLATDKESWGRLRRDVFTV